MADFLPADSLPRSLRPTDAFEGTIGSWLAKALAYFPFFVRKSKVRGRALSSKFSSGFHMHERNNLPCPLAGFRMYPLQVFSDGSWNPKINAGD